MAEEFVKKEEFIDLKNEVNKIREDMVESAKTLQGIDKKLDVISERLVNSDKIDELKLNPLEKRVTKLEDSNTWLWRTLAGALIGIAVKVVFDVSTHIK